MSREQHENKKPSLSGPVEKLISDITYKEPSARFARVSLGDLSIKLCLRNIFCKRLEQIWEFLFESKAEANAILAEIL